MSGWGNDESAGAAGGDKKKGCFKCGEEGHMSRECPTGGMYLYLMKLLDNM